MKHLSLLLIFLMMSSVLTAQKVPSSGIWMKGGSRVAGPSVFSPSGGVLALSARTSFKQVSSRTTPNGLQHVRYQEYYKGLKVLGGVLIQHNKDNRLQSVNGYYWPNLEVNTSPALDVESAKELAQLYCFQQRMMKEEPLQKSPDFDIERPPVLYIADNTFPQYSGRVALVWAVEVSYKVEQIPHKERVLVNAHNGSIVSSIPLIMYDNIEVEVRTKYAGNRTITIDSIYPDLYRLQDNSRGKGIETVDLFTDDLYTSKDKLNWNIHDSESETATDVHFGMEAYYDLLKDSFGYNSIDNQGFKLVGNLHAFQGRAFVNAYWTGEAAFFGDGNCRGYGPLTTLDVVGHEFTHGLTQKTSGLVYRDDPGGLNESMSDIFGKALEYIYDRDNFTWEIGRAFITNDKLEPFRSMSDPNRYNNPKYYRGNHWFNEVHNTSGVMNYWFYLISDGAKGVNEVGDSFDIQGLGLPRAFRIAFAMNAHYLTPISTYPDAVNASIAAVKALYGSQGIELETVMAAWKAVGLGITSYLDNDLSIRLKKDGKIRFFRSIASCEQTRHPVDIVLFNRGKNTVAAGTDIPVKITIDNVSKSNIIHIQNDLKQGDSLEYIFKDSFDLIGKRPGLVFVEVELEKDDYILNNKAMVSYFVVSGKEGLSVGRAALLEPKNKDCLHQMKDTLYQSFSVAIGNTGCVDIPSGSRIDVSFEMNGQIKDATVVLNVPLPITSFLLVDFSGLFPLKGGTNDYKINLSAPFDQYQVDNLVEGTIFFPVIVKNGYKEDFTNGITGNKYFISPSLASSNSGVISYHGNKFMGFASLYKYGSLKVEPCNRVERFFNANYSSGSLEWCVKPEPLKDGSDPLFEFDVVQFRVGRGAFPANKDFQAILRVQAMTKLHKEIFTKYIYGTPIGEVIRYRFPIPTTEEMVRISLSTFLGGHGNISDLRKGDFDQVDAILIDNVTFGKTVVKVDNPSDSAPIRVMPNPAHNVIRFVGEQDVLKGAIIEVREGTGRILMRRKVKGPEFIWTTDDVLPGLYFYTIQQRGGKLRVGKIMMVR